VFSTCILALLQTNCRHSSHDFFMYKSSAWNVTRDLLERPCGMLRQKTQEFFDDPPSAIKNTHKYSSVVTMRCYANAVHGMTMSLSVPLSQAGVVSQWLTFHHATMPHVRHRTVHVVFGCQRSWWNSNGVIPKMSENTRVDTISTNNLLFQKL